MPKKFASEELLKKVIERISNDTVTNYSKTEDLFWEVLEKIVPDATYTSHQEEAINAFLKVYAQMITVESVQLTLDVLTEMGTLGKEG